MNRRNSAGILILLSKCVRHAQLLKGLTSLRKTRWQSIGLVAATTIVGTIADTLLASRLPFLKPHTHVSWHPSFNLVVIQFSMALTLSVNWGTLVGFVAGILFLRRSK